MPPCDVAPYLVCRPILNAVSLAPPSLRTRQVAGQTSSSWGSGFIAAQQTGLPDMGHELPRRFVAVAAATLHKRTRQPAVAVFSVTEASDDLMEI